MKIKMIIKHFKMVVMMFSILIMSLQASFSNVLPKMSTDIPTTTIGVYQTDRRVTIYEKPEYGSKVLLDREIHYSDYTNTKQDNLFAVLVPQKELGYLYVTDTSDDDNWVEVIYNKTENKKGWVYKNDDFQFMPWVNFYNLYGRKYGLVQFKSDEINISGVYSNPDENAQIIGKISNPKMIHLTSIEGIWMLVSILDYNGYTTTGYIKWRTPQGKIFLFPCLK